MLLGAKYKKRKGGREDMVRLSLLLRHKVRDVGGNAHSFAFDTMTKVYRDAVYAKETQTTWNPIFPAQQANTAEAAAAASASAPSASTSTLAQGDTAKKVDGSGAAAALSGVKHRPQRRSGVQVEILNLYRDMLRASQRMEDPQTRKNMRDFIRAEFDRNRDIPCKFITRIEWQLHHGQNKLEELRAMRPDTKFSLMR
ncbi:hypothetical protein TraAM80_01037 [Trypanosoma rangeli]|uniref:Complex 1 LYR protein domain-containing protein n=1 Tax=Trypanosoma rangeli TaxID=5698 RepID=A0A422P0N2_TRYRA|nr:uncharacterized protein TraAM80_01037 [Trypanosoma rangeli]RNF11249.1 hypothetical protein TraAM80_01037 [Trypanosoma rangeli]|eukprot:RNF11249.1 hypothetical protein TraAM80_01037 [Trypanosoma rangeli]